MGLYRGVKGSMIPFKDSPLVLTKDLVLETITSPSNTNNTLYSKMFNGGFSEHYKYITEYDDGVFASGDCYTRMSTGVCYYFDHRHIQWYAPRGMKLVKSLKFFLDKNDINITSEGHTLNPEFIFKKENPLLGILEKVEVVNIDRVRITVPTGTELYISYIKYSKGNNCGVKWNINKSPNPILKKRVLFTPVDNLNRIF